MTTPRRLILFVDGTCNTEWGSLDPTGGTVNGIQTSVRRIFEMVKSGLTTDKSYTQYAQYFQGVGTEHVNKDTVDGNLIYIYRPGALRGSLTGAGYTDILRAAYEWCCRTVSGPKDQIWLFGFSRGAFIVRALASLLQHVGLIERDKMITQSAFRARFNDQLQRYTLNTSANSIRTRDTRPLLAFAYASPKVHFVGVFDTVKAILPRPVTNFVYHGIPFLDLEQDAPILVKHFRHALALNEGRPPFAPTLWQSNAHSSNVGGSFLEAWFFGYHTDVGGGNPFRGLALWPLQWMLASAIEHGLELNDNKHAILFGGDLHTIPMAHENMKMYDMLAQHAAGARYRLRLHEENWYIQTQPRNYRATLTTPDYTDNNSRVSIHPSSYLQFNISSQFRIQIYEWKWFRNFVRDRARAMPVIDAPWWEAETEKNMLQHVLPVRQIRMLIFGKSGIGKLNLINSAFSQHATPPKEPQNINESITIEGNNLVDLHFSPGFGAIDTLDSVTKFIEGYTRETDVDKQLHAIWYCVDLTGDPITGEDLKFSSLKFKEIPVIVVLTNEKNMRDQISQDLRNEGVPQTEDKIEERLERVIARKRGEINGLPEWSYVTTDSTEESIKHVLTATFRKIDSPEVRITHIRAQYASTRQKLAIATDQTTRAYAVWKAYAVLKKEVVFRVAPTGQMTLPEILMDQILRSFNIRFPGDAKLIQSQVGSIWMAGLNNSRINLWDGNIPAHLILCCMVDTMVILGRVMSRESLLTRPERRTQALRDSATQSACLWYRRKQDEVHTRIKALLDSKHLPSKNSMALFQLDLIEIIDFGLASRADAVEETVDVVVGLGRGVVRGAASAALSTVTVGTGLLFGIGHEFRRGLFG